MRKVKLLLLGLAWHHLPLRKLEEVIAEAIGTPQDSVLVVDPLLDAWAEKRAGALLDAPVLRKAAQFLPLEVMVERVRKEFDQGSGWNWSSALKTEWDAMTKNQNFASTDQGRHYLREHLLRVAAIAWCAAEAIRKEGEP